MSDWENEPAPEFEQTPPKRTLRGPASAAVSNDTWANDSTNVGLTRPEESNVGAPSAAAGAQAGGFEEKWQPEVQTEDGRVLPKFVKDFYREHPDVTARSEGEAEAIRQHNKIHIMHAGGGAACASAPVPKPVLTFEEAAFPEYVIANLEDHQLVHPTPVQMQGWPIALSGRDMVGVSETGSGKTLAYLLPAIVHVNAQPELQRGDGPIVLVLTPTVELTDQVWKEACKFAESSNIRCVYAYKGGPELLYKQRHALSKGCEILVATPGRLKDLIRKGATNLRRVTYLVIDEADNLLQYGDLRTQVQELAAQTRKERQTLMWSATWNPEVEAVARQLCRERWPVHLRVGDFDMQVPAAITQHVEVLPRAADWHAYEEHRFARLCAILLEMVPADKVHYRGPGGEGPKKALIFTSTKEASDALATRLRSEGWPAMSLNGLKREGERKLVMRWYREGRCTFLVTTDMAARGLDVPDVRHVVNYDLPNLLQDYVHRVGRTGRAGRKGHAFTFVAPSASPDLVAGIARLMEQANTQVPQELRNLLQQQGFGRRFPAQQGGREGRGGSRYD